MKFTFFGELMLRFKPADSTRIIQATSFEAPFGGVELNVAVSLSVLGDQISFITKLPQNMLGEAAFYHLRGYGVDTAKVLRGGQRMGTYYFEKWLSASLRQHVYNLKDVPIAIYDTGKIGSKIAYYCRLFGIKTIGINTSGHTVPGFDHFLPT